MPPIDQPYKPRKVRRKKPTVSRPPARPPSLPAKRVVRAKPAPAYHPTRTQIRSAHAQERGYRSQGKAIKKVAKQQETTARAKAQERSYRSQGQSVEHQANRQRHDAGVVREAKRLGIPLTRHTLAMPFLPSHRVDVPQLEKEIKALKGPTKLQAAAGAPVLKALEQTTRPLHAVAAATRRDISELKKGHVHLLYDKGALKAAKRGVENKDKSTFSDVLKDVGAPKAVRSVGGFVGDVVLDPTTYITGGAGSVARHAAASAAERTAAKGAVRSAENAAAKRTAAEGERAVQKAAARAKAKGKTLSERHAAQIRRDAEARHAARPVHREAAARHAAKKHANKGSGVIIRAGGREVPGVRRATEAASRPVKKVVRKVTPERAKHSVRSIAADVNPNIVPEGVSKAEHEAVTMATRTARAKTNQGIRIAQDQAVAIRKHIGEKNYQKVIDALEAGKTKDLPEELRPYARAIRDHLRYANRLRKQAGIRGGEIKKRRIHVPEVTADVEGASKQLREAQKERARLEREHRRQIHKAGVAEGKARVLVGQADRKLVRRKRKTRVAGTTPVRTLRRLETERGKLHAIERGTAISRARQAEREAEQRLQETRALARKQRLAQRSALKRKEAAKQEPVGYVPRQPTEEYLNAKNASGHRGSGSKTIRPSYERARAERRTLKILREEEPGKYSEDLARLYGERVAAGHADVAKAELNRRLADLGRTVKKGDELRLARGESVYHVKGSDISGPLKEGDVAKVLEEGGKSGRYVVLNDEVVKRALEGVAPHLKSAYGIGRALDKTTVGFKRIAIATPGFHVRNFAGDVQNAYLHQPGHALPGNLGRAGRVLKAAGRMEKADRNFAKASTTKATLKTGRYGRVPLDQVAHKLAEAGAYRSGYISRELPELAKSGAEGSLKIRKVGFPRAVKEFGRNREDLPRLASAIYALRHGATWEEAAARVAEAHFDYGHLTSFERNVARRLIPFYTFSARNIPLQARKFITNPGKYANYEKVREEFAKATGADQQNADVKAVYDQLRKAGVKLPAGWEQQLSEWEQRNAGVPVSIGGHKFTVSLGLPLQDLSEFPGMAGANQAREYYDKFMSLVSPVVKDPVEFGANFSFFFRDQIENDHSPLVTAPGWVGLMPPAFRKDMGVVKIIDKKTGKKVWGWRAKADYIAKALPGSPSYLQQLSAGGTDRRGRNTGGKLLAFFGVKSVPIDPVKNAVSLAYQRGQEISKQLSALDQQGINAKHPTARYRTLKAQQATLNAVIEGTTNGLNRRLIEVDNRLNDVKAKLQKSKRSDDGFYYTAQYQTLLDQKKALEGRRNQLLGKKPSKAVRLSRRPMTLRQKVEQQRNELRSGNLRQKLERDVARERARTRIISGG